LLWEGISFIPDETVIPAVTRLSLPRLWEQRLQRECGDDCCVGEAILLRMAAPYVLYEQTAGYSWTDYTTNTYGKGIIYNRSHGQNTGQQKKLDTTCQHNLS
jgi:hypothetical protein